MKELLVNLLDNTLKLNEKHYGTLFGERSSGSKWGFPMTLEILLNFEWVLKEKKAPYPGSDEICTYYTAPLANNLIDDIYSTEEPKFQCNVLTVEACLNTSIPIVVVEGDHGLEMQVHEDYIDQSKVLIDSAKWKVVTLITGPNEGEDKSEIIWTVHPGPAMNPIPQEIAGKSVTKGMMKQAINALDTPNTLFKKDKFITKHMAVKIPNLESV